MFMAKNEVPATVVLRWRMRRMAPEWCSGLLLDLLGLV